MLNADKQRKLKVSRFVVERGPGGCCTPINEDYFLRSSKEFSRLNHQFPNRPARALKEPEEIARDERSLPEMAQLSHATLMVDADYDGSTGYEQVHIKSLYQKQPSPKLAFQTTSHVLQVDS